MKRNALAALSVLAAAASAVGQTSIPLVNHDFEQPGTVKISTDWTQVPGWNADANPSDSGVESGWTTSGTWSGYLRNGDPAIWQLTSHTIGAGDVFDLQFLSRNNWSQGSGGGQVPGSMQGVLYYDDGGVRTVFGSLDAITLNSTGVAEEFALSGVVPPAEAIGRLLGVQFANVTDTGSGGGPGSSWLLIDNIRLTLVPEPSVFALCAVALGTMLLSRCQR